MGDNIDELLKPCAQETLKRFPVSRAVNSPKNDGPERLERVRAEQR
jgi:putative SOS response-associated peptidase YedK